MQLAYLAQHYLCNYKHEARVLLIQHLFKMIEVLDVF